MQQQPEDTAATGNYSDIINRIEQNLSSNQEPESAGNKRIDEASGESDERVSQAEEEEEKKNHDVAANDEVD